MISIAKKTCLYSTLLYTSGSIATYIYNDNKIIILNNDPSRYHPSTLTFSKIFNEATYHKKKIIQAPSSACVNYYKGIRTTWHKDKLSTMTEDQFRKFVEFEIKHSRVSRYYREIMSILLSITGDEKYILPNVSKGYTEW